MLQFGIVIAQILHGPFITLVLRLRCAKRSLGKNNQPHWVNIAAAILLRQSTHCCVESYYVGSRVRYRFLVLFSGQEDVTRSVEPLTNQTILSDFLFHHDTNMACHVGIIDPGRI
jgi:hypothetical protein